MDFLQTRDSPRMMNACKNYYVKPQKYDATDWRH